ncbi:uncharacterized protein LOC128340111 [Hemicordylus capensis]|uniref:uncharacterized protein LOC128340111 n=1 Tax=Hemicordylus capensis TaxID=884348 RepID=UPI002302F905|nr:uncharacterized protein LOC128340111 [Hemicordylus capensis]
MLLPLCLVVHLIMLFPGRSWSPWKDAHNDSYSWSHSLQVMGEKFEEYVRTIYHLLQTLDDWMEEHLGFLEKLVNDHVKKFQEWLEGYIKALSMWLNMYFWTLQEDPDPYTEDVDYKLGKEILVHDKCWEEHIDKADTWLDYINITLYKWLDEDPLSFYNTLQDSHMGSSLQDYSEIHNQHLEDQIKILGQLLDNYTATISKWLKGYATVKEAPSQKYGWNLLHLGPEVQTLGRAQATALQGKCLHFIKRLEEGLDALEHWLWDTIDEQPKKNKTLKALSSAFG